MKIYLGFTENNTEMAQRLQTTFSNVSIELLEPKDAVYLGTEVAECVMKDPESVGVILEDYGYEAFASANKNHGVICAQLSDEHSARMTKDHNNTRIAVIGTQISGPELIMNMFEKFVTSTYSGGRHQIRIDMLDRLVGEK